MSRLRTDPNLDDPDGIYAALVALHEGLSADASRLVNAKLILLLANHIGDAEVLHEAMAVARDGIEPAPQPPGGSDQA